MNKIISLLLILMAFSFGSSAQNAAADTSSTTATDTASLRISLLTCGTGDDLYAIFGHTAIRVQDLKLGSDLVYNYGTFQFGDGFYSNFIMGKLRYWLDTEHFDRFTAYYQANGRAVKEQVLQLDGAQAQQVYDYLKKNAREENKYYDYDFIYDNCATRVRDVFSHNFPGTFSYGNILKNQKVTFRQLLNQYMLQDHWLRFGVNLVLGSRVDSTMGDEQSMFIPDMLYAGTKGAVLDGEPFVAAEQQHVAEAEHADRTFNAPFWVFFALFLLTLAVFYVPALDRLRPIWTAFFLAVTGLLGLVLVFLWFGTAHRAMGQNWNVLWALPTNVIVLFFLRRHEEWMKLYALAAISCMLVALVVHVLGMQHLPLNELIPFFGVMLFVYMDVYRKGLQATVLKQRAAEEPTA